MKKLELILAILSIIAFIMKALLLPWSGQIFTFAIMGLCLIYMTSSYLYQDTTNFKQLFQRIISTQRNLKYFGRGFAIILLASLFKLSFWGKGDVVFLIGFTLVIINLAINYFRKSKSHFKIVIHRSAIIGGIGLLVYLVPQSSLIDIYHRNNPEYTKFLRKSIEDPDNKDITEKLYKLQDELDQ